jgi:hypothetical protein
MIRSWIFFSKCMDIYGTWGSQSIIICTHHNTINVAHTLVQLGSKILCPNLRWMCGLILIGKTKNNPWMWINIKLMSLIYHLIWIHIQKFLSTWCEINMIDLIFCQINMVEFTKPWFFVKLIWSSRLNHDHFDQPFIYLFILIHPVMLL